MRDALLIIDVINDLEFPGGEKVLPWARRMIGPLVRCRAAAHRVNVPVIYVNDNFGHWKSDFAEVFRHCTRPAARGAQVSRRIRPTRRDYFILKPRHSGFYRTSLVPLPEHLRIQRLILTGIATNISVLFTAHDAHMREFRTVALSDCCAAETDHDHNLALEQLKRFCGTRICRGEELRWGSPSRKRR